MFADDTNTEDQDKGLLVYQQSKTFGSESFLINVYDNTKRKLVTFEIYGLETQDMLHMAYNYQDFDGLFRFNAELMNPNRKEGRFDWVVRRLTIATVGKDRKLKLNPDPTEEVPELPIYETNRKIPTGRMDLKERQRLREQMDMLDIKRSENIAKKKAASRERFLKHVFWLKEEEKRKNTEKDEKLAAERQLRVQLKDEAERKVMEAEKAARDKQRHRKKVVEAKDARSAENLAEEYRQLRKRWRIFDAERAKAIADAKEHQAREKATQKAEEAQNKARAAEIQARREAALHARSERIQRKDAVKLKKILEVKAERLRVQKMRQERNQESLRTLHAQRQPVFKAQLQRTEERQKALEAFAQSVNAYIEKRAIPKKVNKKSKSAKAAAAAAAATAAKGKEDPSKKKAKGEKDQKVAATDKVLDAVEAKMRAEMEEASRRQKLDKVRAQMIAAKVKAHEDKLLRHMQEVRESYRIKKLSEEKKASERRIVHNQKEAERAAAEERKKQELERLNKVREQNIARKEQQRLAALAA
jgi:hypothetical protein